MTGTSWRTCGWTLALLMAGCAQVTTSPGERARLQSAADAADAAYLACLGEQADRYLGSTDDVRAIFTMASKNCGPDRDAAGRAHSAVLTTRYMLADREVAAALQALDARGEAAVTDQVLNRQAKAPAAAVATAVASPAQASAPPAPVASRAGDGYLACMQAQGERWATVQEPATVIADTAHSRCAGELAGQESAAGLEKQGRALVTGIVLDRKAGAPAPAAPR